MAPNIGNIFGGHQRKNFQETCGTNFCDTRFEFCDTSAAACFSCTSYELLALGNEQFKPLFNINCRDYITFKSSQLSSNSAVGTVFSHPPGLLDNMAYNSGNQHGAASPSAHWLESEKDLLFFLTKLHLCITGLLLAMVVFLVGSKVKRMRRTRQSCRVKLGDPLLWDTKLVNRKEISTVDSKAAKKLIDSPPMVSRKDMDKPSNTGSMFLSNRYQPPGPTSCAAPPISTHRIPPPAASSTQSSSTRRPPTGFPLLSRPPITVGGPPLSSTSLTTRSVSEGLPSLSSGRSLEDTSDCCASRSDFDQLLLTTPLHPNSPNMSTAPSNSIIGGAGGSSQFRFDEVPVTYAQEDSDARSSSRRHT